MHFSMTTLPGEVYMEQPLGFVIQESLVWYVGDTVPYMASSRPLEPGLVALASWYRSLV